MTPSTSSSPNPAGEATFKVGTRELSADLSAVGTEQGARDLGTVSATRFAEILTRLAGLAAGAVFDADPHLVVTARRGRFLVRPSRGKLHLFDANDTTRTPLELTAAEVPAYLEGTEISAATPEVASLASSSEAVANRTRMGLVVGMLTLSALSVATSAYFTFRSTSIDADVSYTTVSAPAELASLRAQFAGEFTTGTGPNSRTLTLRPDGKLTLVEHGPDQLVVVQLADTYQVALRDGQIAVARTATLGPIELRDAKTLFYAGELYTRRP